MSRVVLAYHGTRSRAGRQVAQAVATAVARRIGEPAGVGFVDVATPRLADLVLDADTVIVPCFLGRGHHVEVDVAEAKRRFGCRASEALTVPGQSPPAELIDALDERVDEIGGPGDAAILGWAGSSSATSQHQATQAARALSQRWQVPVLPATPATAPDAVATLRAEGGGDTVVASYLLAPGFFADRFAALDGARVSAPVGDHPRLVDLILRRIRAVDEPAGRTEQAGQQT